MPAAAEGSRRPGTGPSGHLLYASWTYPPSRSSGSYRTLATANAFAHAGWDVTVLTVDRSILASRYGLDLSLERRIDPRVRVRRVRFDEPLREVDLAEFSRLRVASETTWYSAARRWGRRSFPEALYGPWRRHLRAAAELVHGEHPVDLVIGSAAPNVSFTAGWHLHRHHGVPYVMDYRDSWGLDLYRDRRAFPATSREGRWEQRLVDGAAEVWFVNEPIRDWYVGEFPALADRAHVVANGFDGDVGAQVTAAREALGRHLRLETGVADAPSAEPGRPAGSPPEGLTFCYLGTLYGGMPVAEVLAGWRLARERDERLARSRLAVHGHLGHSPGVDLGFGDLLRAHAGDGVEYRGPVAKDEAPRVYAEADVLVLFLAPGKYVTSGKVFEYAATGLPVISLHDPGSPATAILRDSPLWRGAPSMSAEDVARTFSAGADLARRITGADVAATQEWARRYSRSRQLSPRIAELGELVADASPSRARAVRAGEDAASRAIRRPSPGTGADPGSGSGTLASARRILLVVGSDRPADDVLAEATGGRGIGELLGSARSTSQPGQDQPPALDLLCRRAPSAPIPGVGTVRVIAEPSRAPARLLRRILDSAPARTALARARESVPGRVALSYSPADEGRSTWRAARGDQGARAFTKGTDLLVAVDVAAVPACWHWLREGLAPEAIRGIAAAALRLRPDG